MIKYPIQRRTPKQNHVHLQKIDAGQDLVVYRFLPIYLMEVRVKKIRGCICSDPDPPRYP
jgi:hypothetical protein